MNPNTLFADKSLQSFLLREKRAVMVPSSVGQQAQATESHAAFINADLGSLGFALKADVMQALRSLDIESLNSFHRNIISVARDAVGAHVRYRPLFKNFQEGVPETSTYFIARLLGYAESLFGPLSDDHTVLTCGHIVNHKLFNLKAFGACPICQHQVPELSASVQEEPKYPLSELTPMRLLGLASVDDVWATFGNIASARTSISDSYKDFVAAVLRVAPEEALRRLPAEMPFKENATYLVGHIYAQLRAEGINLAAGNLEQKLLGHIKTPTDVLRVAVAFCAGDVSLKEVTKFKLGNAQRVFLLKAFDALKQSEGAILEEMLGYRGRWLRLGEVLHVGQYQKRFTKAFACFDVLRNKEETITTHAARVEKLMVNSDLQKPEVRNQLLNTLTARPGDFARKVDTLLARKMPEGEVLGALQSVIGSVSTTILLTMLAHFRRRAQREEFRAFMPKGSIAKMFVIEQDTRAPLTVSARLGVIEVVETELRKRFRARGTLGKVFVDEALENVVVPFSQRSASTGLVPLTRGSRVPMAESAEFVRMFVHWAETPETGTIDVDLTAGLYDEDWNKLDHLSWTSTSSYGQSVHSGDVRSASGPDGACEFIDIDVAALRYAGVRYVTMLVFSWTGQKFSDFPCFAGFMEREQPGKGGHFEAKTVKHKFAVTADMVICVPALFDVETTQFVWADLSVKGQASYNCVENIGDRTVSMFKAVLAMQHQRVSLKELFELHGSARGELVASAEAADKAFDMTCVEALDDVVANWL